MSHAATIETTGPLDSTSGLFLAPADTRWHRATSAVGSGATTGHPLSAPGLAAAFSNAAIVKSQARSISSPWMASAWCSSKVKTWHWRPGSFAGEVDRGKQDKLTRRLVYLSAIGCSISHPASMPCLLSGWRLASRAPAEALSPCLQASAAASCIDKRSAPRRASEQPARSGCFVSRVCFMMEPNARTSCRDDQRTDHETHTNTRAVGTNLTAHGRYFVTATARVECGDAPRWL